MAAFIAAQTARRERIVRFRRNPMELPDHFVVAEFRLTKSMIRDLSKTLEPELKRSTQRSNALTVEEQVFIALKVLASGSFQNCAKYCVDVGQSTVSKVLDDFLDALGRHAAEHIHMPRNLLSVKGGFFDLCGFPGVIGAIDCTHVALIAPAVNEHLYVCRKGFHSINVQAVCDHNLIFTDIVTKWPGSTHDAFILRNWSLLDRFEAGEFGNSIILGDSGYPLKSWLMTPMLRKSNAADEAYNNAHSKTRVLIEKAFGVLKQRWRILDHTGGALCYTPLKVCKIFLCCAILHNMCRRNNVPLPLQATPSDDEREQEISSDVPEPSAVAARAAIAELLYRQRQAR